MMWDQSTIGFRDDRWADIKRVETDYGFESALEAIKFLFSIGFAISKRDGSGLKSEKGQTRYNTGSVDPDQAILSVMNTMQNLPDDISGNEVFEALVGSGSDWLQNKKDQYGYLTITNVLDLMRSEDVLPR